MVVEYILWTRALANTIVISCLGGLWKKDKTACLECFTSCTSGPESSHSTEFGVMIHQILKMCSWTPVYEFKCKSNFCDDQKCFVPGLEAYILLGAGYLVRYQQPVCYKPQVTEHKHKLFFFSSLELPTLNQVKTHQQDWCPLLYKATQTIISGFPTITLLHLNLALQNFLLPCSQQNL